MESPLLHRTTSLSCLIRKKDTKSPRNKSDVQMTMRMRRLVMITRMILMMLLICFDNDHHYVWYVAVYFVYTVVVSIHDWNWIVLPLVFLLLIWCCFDVFTTVTDLLLLCLIILLPHASILSHFFFFFFFFFLSFFFLSKLLQVIWYRNDAK